MKRAALAVLILALAAVVVLIVLLETEQVHGAPYVAVVVFLGASAAVLALILSTVHARDIERRQRWRVRR